MLGVGAHGRPPTQTWEDLRGLQGDLRGAPGRPKRRKVIRSPDTSVYTRECPRIPIPMYVPAYCTPGLPQGLRAECGRLRPLRTGLGTVKATFKPVSMNMVLIWSLFGTTSQSHQDQLLCFMAAVSGQQTLRGLGSGLPPLPAWPPAGTPTSSPRVTHMHPKMAPEVPPQGQ